MFCRRYNTRLAEDWTDHDSNEVFDKRIEYIDQTVTSTTTQDIALYGDGSYIEGQGATQSAQPLRFDKDAEYFNKTEPDDMVVKARLPDRF